jgi:hypothetical protein
MKKIQVLISLLLMASVGYSQVKISALPAATGNISGSVVSGVQAGVTKKFVVDSIAKLATAYGPTSSNGISKVANNFKLGGALTEPTTITASAMNTLSLKGLEPAGDPLDSLLVRSPDGVIRMVSELDVIQALNYRSGIERIDNDVQLGGTLTQPTTITTDAANVLKIAGLERGNVNTDSLLLAAGDGTLKKVSSNRLNKVDSTTTSNGLNIVGKDVRLGGNLAQATTISNNANPLTIATGGTALNITGLTSGAATDSLVTVNTTTGKINRINATGFYWGLNGNTITNSIINFIGITNNTHLRFRTNNLDRMVIDSTGRIGFNNILPSTDFEVQIKRDFGAQTKSFFKTDTFQFREREYQKSSLECNLYNANTNVLIDGFLINYWDLFSNAVDNFDVRKAGGNIGIKNGTFNLVVERKNLIKKPDTTVIYFNQVNQDTFYLRIGNINNISSTYKNVRGNFTAYLQDNFLGINTPLSKTNFIEYPFRITGDGASYALGRFKIIYTDRDINFPNVIMPLDSLPLITPEYLVAQIGDTLKKTLLSSISRPYKVYTAQLTQSGTGAPNVNVLENTLGFTLVFGRTAAGEYTITKSGGGLIANPPKMYIDFIKNNQNAGTKYSTNTLDGSSLGLTTADSANVSTDDLMLFSLLEIRIYP